MLTRLILVLLVIISALLYPQTGISKQGGVCFRVDDNNTSNLFQDYANVFNIYGEKFSFSVNLGRSVDFVSANSSYTNLIRSIQDAGHELMDHSPDHRVNFFRTRFNPNDYIGLAGVDHIIADKICLKFQPSYPSFSASVRSGTANIVNNKITPVAPAAFDFNGPPYRFAYIYFPNLPVSNKIYLMSVMRADSILISDLWEEQVSIGTYNGQDYYIYTPYDFTITDDAILLLGKETLKSAQTLNLGRPVTWIQPGNPPELKPAQVKSIFGDSLGYVGGAVYPDKSLKVFNEYDPNNDKKFGMEWGDFQEELQSLPEVKRRIADGIAKNYVMINETHFAPGGGLTWEQFLVKLGELIQWMQLKNIPIRTYSEWAGILYEQMPNPTQNVFPKLNIDLDENGIPDGIALTPQTTWYNNDGVALSDNYSIGINQQGYLASVYYLGGIEKGDNEFKISVKGTPGNIITVYIDPDGSEGEEPLEFPIELTNNWVEHTISPITVPATSSTINFQFACTQFVGGEAKISGISFLNNNPLPVELSLFNGRLIGKQIKLEWRTESEKNNYGFEIQKYDNQSNSLKWEKTGFVPGSGNSNSPKSYSFSDEINGTSGKMSYRLKQIDSDGKYQYSEIVNIDLGIPEKFELYQNYPNPFNPSTIIRYDLNASGHVGLKIFDILGREVKVLLDEYQGPGNHKLEFDGSSMNSGVYIYSLTFNGTHYNKKMLLIK